jgi:hypothetical protein
MLEMASFLKYVDLYLTSEWGRFYVGHPIQRVSKEICLELSRTKSVADHSSLSTVVVRNACSDSALLLPDTNNTTESEDAVSLATVNCALWLVTYGSSPLRQLEQTSD